MIFSSVLRNLHFFLQELWGVQQFEARAGPFQSICIPFVNLVHLKIQKPQTSGLSRGCEPFAVVALRWSSLQWPREGVAAEAPLQRHAIPQTISIIHICFNFVLDLFFFLGLIERNHLQDFFFGVSCNANRNNWFLSKDKDDYKFGINAWGKLLSKRHS